MLFATSWPAVVARLLGVLMVRNNRSLYWALCLLFVVGCGPALRKPRVGPATRRAAEPPASHPTSDVLNPTKLQALDRAEAEHHEPYQVGIASYYGKRFHGRRTAYGERFNMYQMTAAHRALPHGTLLRVTNRKNGRCVQVTVNDRGPYVKGRVLDLSYEAARCLGMVRDGVTEVEIDILDDPRSPGRFEPAEHVEACGGASHASY